jgi:hypothetical protein
MRSRDQIARIAVRLVLVLLIGLLPWPGIREISSTAFRTFANAALSVLSCSTKFGAGRARLLPASKPSTDGPSWDTMLRITLEEARDTDEVYVNPRRLAYLPVLVFTGLVFAVPLRLRARLKCFAIGVPALLFYAVSNLWIMALWLFAQEPDLLTNQSGIMLTAIDLGYRALVVPLCNRFVVPLLLAVLLIGHEWVRAQPLDASTRVTRQARSTNTKSTPARKRA